VIGEDRYDGDDEEDGRDSLSVKIIEFAGKRDGKKNDEAVEYVESILLFFVLEVNDRISFLNRSRSGDVSGSSSEKYSVFDDEKDEENNFLSYFP
jgi:hypothetical protein